MENMRKTKNHFITINGIMRFVKIACILAMDVRIDLKLGEELQLVVHI